MTAQDILTAEEIIENIEPKAEIRGGRGCLYGSDDMVMMFEKGKTDEWLRHKELRETVRSYQCESGQFGKLKKALENLNPSEQ